MNAQDFTEYDQSEVFRTQMKPLLMKLHEVAEAHQINFVGLTQYMQRHTDEGLECGIAQTIVLNGSKRTAPSMAAAAACTTKPALAMAALAISASLDGGSRPDDRAAMMQDGDDKDLAGVADKVNALLGHAAAPSTDAPDAS